MASGVRQRHSTARVQRATVRSSRCPASGRASMSRATLRLRPTPAPEAPVGGGPPAGSEGDGSGGVALSARREHFLDADRFNFYGACMRAVLLGKGGSGKSTLAGLLATELSGRGGRVVAMDADTVPGLSQVLGMEPTDDWFLADMAKRDNGGWRLEGTPTEVVDSCSREGPGAVRFLQVGNADATLKDFEFRREGYPDRWSGTIAFNTVARLFDDESGWVIVDLQGGTLQVAGGTVGTTGIAMVVVEPFAKSVLTARRFVGMGDWPSGVRLVGVANKVASPEDQAYVKAELTRLDIPLWATVPLDPAVQAAERHGRPLVTLASHTPARVAVAGLADRLHEVSSTLRTPADA